MQIAVDTISQSIEAGITDRMWKVSRCLWCKIGGMVILFVNKSKTDVSQCSIMGLLWLLEGLSLYS